MGWCVIRQLDALGAYIRRWLGLLGVQEFKKRALLRVKEGRLNQLQISEKDQQRLLRVCTEKTIETKLRKE